MSKFKLLAKAHLPWALKHRRHIHRFPELSFEEINTSNYCKDILKKMGLEIIHIWGNGFVADLKTSGAKKTIAWRSELDALPIYERSCHGYRSENKGIAHMCGHDMHMAIALLGAKILSDNRSCLKNNVRLIFQPAEELPPGGAIKMISNGCLEGVDEIYGLHNDILYDTQTVLIKPGAVTAGGFCFEVQLIGKGAHVATPKLALDPILAASKLIQVWYEKIKQLDLFSTPYIFNITKISAGSASNVIPEEALLGGTIRSYNEEDMKKIELMLKEQCNFLKELGYKILFKRNKTYPPTINSESGAEKVYSSACRVVGKKKVINFYESTLCGEDFSYYLQKRMGAFFFLGTRNMKKKIFYPQHSPNFDIDEDAIALGSAIMVELMLS